MKFIIQPGCHSLKEYDLFIEEVGNGERLSCNYPKVTFQMALQKQEFQWAIPIIESDTVSIKAITEYDLTENHEIVGLLYFQIESEGDNCTVAGTQLDWEELQKKIKERKITLTWGI